MFAACARFQYFPRAFSNSISVRLLLGLTENLAATLALEKERKEASHHVANVLSRDRAQPRPCGAEAQRALGFRDEVPCGLGTLGVGRGVLGLSVTLIGHFGAFCEVFRLARTQRLRQT